MAGHGETSSGAGGHPAGHNKVDVRTYDRMIGALKWGGLACFLLAALVIWLIAG